MKNSGIETPIIALPSAKHYEVVKTINLTNHVYNAGVMMVSKRKFDAMPKNIQANLREAAHEGYIPGMTKSSW